MNDRHQVAILSLYDVLHSFLSSGLSVGCGTSNAADDSAANSSNNISTTVISPCRRTDDSTNPGASSGTNTR